MNCTTCKFFRKNEQAADGICRRRSPGPTLLTAFPGGQFAMVWPTVKLTDWCGEHITANPFQPGDAGSEEKP